MTMTDPAQSDFTKLSAVLPRKLHVIGGLPPYAEAVEFDLFLDEQYRPLLSIESTSIDLAYVVVDPTFVFRNYAPVVAAADLQEVGLQPGDERLLLTIVNLSRGVENATTNLAGPLLVNPKTGNAKQIVPSNAQTFSCRQPLLSAVPQETH